MQDAQASALYKRQLRAAARTVCLRLTALYIESFCGRQVYVSYTRYGSPRHWLMPQERLGDAASNELIVSSLSA